jgi:hypothetical protein
VVCEPFDAPSLATLLARSWQGDAPLPPKVLERIGERLCDALDAAHARSPPLLHGALTPGSVLVQVTPKVIVRVADFALVPEDASSGGARGDLVGLCAVLRAMFAASAAPGQPPASAGQDWRRDDLPDALWDLATSAAVGREGASVEAFRAALEAAWRRPVEGRAQRPAATTDAPASRAEPMDGSTSAATEVSFLRQETTAAAPPERVPSPPADATERSFHLESSAAPPTAPQREPTVMLDVGWAPPPPDAPRDGATARAVHGAPRPPASPPEDATERVRIERPSVAHAAIVSDTVAVAHIGLPASAGRAPDDPTLLATPSPPSWVGEGALTPSHSLPPTGPPEALQPPVATDTSRTWVVALAFGALFVLVATVVALR